MIIQYIIIGIILAVCLVYAAKMIYTAIKATQNCKDYKCAGCAFYDSCKKNHKKVGKKFGGIK